MMPDEYAEWKGSPPKLPEGWREHPEVKRFAREVFTAGWRLSENERGYSAPSDPRLIAEEAQRRFPITRRVPRVWRDRGLIEWVVQPNGNIGYRTGNGDHALEPTTCTLTEDRVRAWADLLARPFEEVEE